MQNVSTLQDYVALLLGGIVQGSDVLQVHMGGSGDVVSENETAGASEKKTVVTDVPEGSGLRLDSEKVLEVEVQNVNMTLQ